MDICFGPVEMHTTISRCVGKESSFFLLTFHYSFISSDLIHQNIAFYVFFFFLLFFECLIRPVYRWSFWPAGQMVFNRTRLPHLSCFQLWNFPLKKIFKNWKSCTDDWSIRRTQCLDALAALLRQWGASWSENRVCSLPAAAFLVQNLHPSLLFASDWTYQIQVTRVKITKHLDLNRVGVARPPSARCLG